MLILKKIKTLTLIRKDFVLELLIISLLITPFQNLLDLIWMFSPSSMGEWDIVHTPLIVKALKDIILILVIPILFLQNKKSNFANKIVIFLLITILTTASIKAYILKTPIDILFTLISMNNLNILFILAALFN